MSDTLMISVSGIRGHVGTDLTPEIVARYAAALGAWSRQAAGSIGASSGGTRPRRPNQRPHVRTGGHGGVDVSGG